MPKVISPPYRLQDWQRDKEEIRNCCLEHTHISLLIGGPRGSGKSFVAGAITGLLEEMGYEVAVFDEIAPTKVEIFAARKRDSKPWPS